MELDTNRYMKLHSENSQLSEKRKRWANQDFILLQILVVSVIVISSISAILIGTSTEIGKIPITILAILPGTILSLERALNIPLRHLRNHEAYIYLKLLLVKLERDQDVDSVAIEFYKYQQDFENRFPLGVIPQAK